MRNSLNSVLSGFFSIGILVHSVFACAETSASINKETSKYVIDIKYPQGFSDPQINSVVKEFINKTQKSFLDELAKEDTADNTPGKTGIKVIYSVPYHSINALSVRFDISTYHRGAAHPLNTIEVQNFIKGQKVNLADLFLPNADYLKALSVFCNQAITKKNISDPDWIKEGTKANTENYSSWNFTDKGIDIIFNSYQVAAYVYGEQTVAIPSSVLKPLLKPETAQMLWGN